MNSDVTTLVFAADVLVLCVLLGGAVAALALPRRRIWPPPGRRSWQYLLTWIGWWAAIGLGAALLLLDWNSWIFQSPLRFIVGVPLTLLGGLLAVWGMWTAGWTNTSGLRAGFVASGPYRFTRNPQYVGDIVFFAGVGVMANSVFLWIAHFLLSLWFAMAPLLEEPWLEEQYGEPYREYLRRVPRFL